jgi:hypothetical protein
MTIDEALQIVAHVCSLAPMPKADHIRTEQALSLISEQLKKPEAKPHGE